MGHDNHHLIAPKFISKPPPHPQSAGQQSSSGNINERYNRIMSASTKISGGVAGGNTNFG